VAALTTRDAERALRFVADAEELGVDEPFTPQVLEELGKLIRADWLTYCEQDRVRKRVRHVVSRIDDNWEDDGVTVSYWDIADEHPVCSWHNRGDFRALKLSDFLTVSQLRRSRIYDAWFRPGGVERELDVAIPSPPWHTKTFLFDRRPGPDFTERDRLLLDLLQPHFGRLWRAAQTRRRLRAALTALEWESEREGRGVIVLTPGAGIEAVSPTAHRLVREFFGAARETDLTPALADWLESSAQTMQRHDKERHLTIDRSGDALLLQATRDELRLTARERQILAWVARGKRNLEIAQTLWIAPTTVRKHLEHIYAKLGVHTRTAAAARFLGVLENDERQASLSG